MVVLGLGSNIGDRMHTLGEAVRLLSGVLADMRESRVLESPALLWPDSPPEWDIPFLNMAVSGTTGLTPQALLSCLKAIEQALGRQARGKWGPREIDIDILAMDDMVLDAPDIAVPHSGLLERDFALLPLAEVAPEWRYPRPGPYLGCSASEIAAGKGFALGNRLRDAGKVAYD